MKIAMPANIRQRIINMNDKRCNPVDLAESLKLPMRILYRYETMKSIATNIISQIHEAALCQLNFTSVDYKVTWVTSRASYYHLAMASNGEFSK